jgi:hypothetical protein
MVLSMRDAPTTPEPRPRIPALPAWLGGLGLIPFVAMALMIISGTTTLPINPVSALISYGAVILSFLGGIYWGLALAPPIQSGSLPEPKQAFVIGVIPSIIGWIALLLPHTIALSVLVAGFAGQWLVDRRTARHGHFPGWFGPLRTRLSAVVMATLLLSLSLRP